MFRFADPTWLWALILIPVLLGLIFWAAGARRRALERFADPDLVERLTQSVNPIARRWKTGLRLMAVTGLLVALARPQFGSRVETVRSVGQDVVVAMDLSRSMLAEDVSPSRLERARLAVLRLMDRLDGDRIGLVAFAADAFIQSPLTIDYAAAGLFLNAMEPDLMPVQGTNLSAALRMSMQALEDGARDARVLVMVTDGEHHEVDHGGFGEELRQAVESGVQVYLVGVGGTEGAPIPLYDAAGVRQGFLRDDEGNVVTTRLGQEIFERIVQETGATYVRIGGGGTALDDLVDEIVRGEGEEVDAMQVTRFEEQFQIFLALAWIALLADVLLSDRRRMQEEWAGRFE